jgi:ATP-dependent protease ClpP protease subunit
VEFKYTQNPTAKKPIILVDQYIGTDANGVTGIDGGQFTREILALKNAGVTEAEVWINSKGGEWNQGVSIVGSMTNSGIDFTTRNLGFADSTAGHILQAGKKRVFNSYALSLVHEIQGNGSETVLEAMNASVATMLQPKTNRTVEEVRTMMKEGTMMDAATALKYGFCDAVEQGNDILRFTNSSEAYAAGKTQIANLLPKNKSMHEVNQVLGLTNEASEGAQLTAINAILTARNVAETALAEKVTALEAANTVLTATNAKLVVAENTILTATNENKRILAETLVQGHLGTRIVDTPENVLRFTNMAIADYDNTKAVIEAINLNTKAPLAPTQERSKNAPVTSVAEYMAN